MTGPDSPSSAAEKAREEFVRPFEEELARLRRQDESSRRRRLHSEPTYSDVCQSFEYWPAEQPTLQQRSLAIGGVQRQVTTGGDALHQTTFAAGVPPMVGDCTASSGAALSAPKFTAAEGLEPSPLGKTHVWQLPSTEPRQASSPTSVTSARESASLPLRRAGGTAAPLFRTAQPLAYAGTELVSLAEVRGTWIRRSSSEAVDKAKWEKPGDTRTSSESSGSRRRPRSSGGSGGGGAVFKLRKSLHELESEYEKLRAQKHQLEREIAELEGLPRARSQHAGSQQLLREMLPDECIIVADSPPKPSAADAELRPEQSPATADPLLRESAMDCVNWDILLS